MAYKPHPIINEGGKKQVEVSDDDTQELLLKILKELKIIAMHLSVLTDNQITNEEVES